MLRVRVCATHMGGFWVQNSLIWVPFGRLSLNIGGHSRKIGKKLSKTGSFPPKFIIKEGITATAGNIRIRRG